MAVLRINRSFWLDGVAVGEVPRYDALRGEHSADVVIIGGGVTGAAVGFELASAGMRVAILEGRTIGRGSTAASTALLMQEPDEDLRALEERYGRKAARQTWQLSRQATKDLIRTIRRLRIPCDLVSRDSVYYTVDAAATLRREHRRRLAAGLNVRWLDRAALERVTNIAGTGAIRTRGNAQADPYRVCAGLIAAAANRGADVFEHTPARRVRTSVDAAIVETPRGSVRANHVVVATGYATPEFKQLRARFRLKHTYVVVTSPIPAATRQQIGLGPVMLWDTDRPYHYARWTEDGRLMMGGADRPRTTGTARFRALRKGITDVRAYFERLFPALSGVPIDYAWEGLFATTPDGLPYIGPHRHFPRHLFALGYGGNGMTFAALAARLIREELAGRVRDHHRLFSFARHRQARRRGRKHG